MDKKKRLLYSGSTFKDLHGEISSGLSMLLKHKSSLELTLKQKEQKIELLQNFLESQREVIKNLQLDCEKLNAKCTADLEVKEEIFKNYLSIHEQYVALKKRLEDIEKQLDHYKETCQLIDKKELERELKLKELQQSFVELTIGDKEKVSILNDAIKVRDKELTELHDTLNLTTLERDNQVDSLIKMIESQKNDISNYQALLLECDENFKMEQNIKEELKEENVKLTALINNNEKDISDYKKKIKDLEVQFEKLEESYNYAVSCNNNFEVTNSRLEEEIKNLKQLNEEQMLKFEKNTSEIQEDRDREEKRAEEISAELENLKICLAELENQKKECMDMFRKEKDEKAILEIQIKEGKEATDSLSDEKNKLLSDLAILEQKIETIMKKNLSTEKLLEDETNAKQALNIEVDELKSKLQSLTLNNVTENKNVQEKIAELMKEKSDAENIIEEMKKNIAEERNAKEALEQTLVEKNGDILRIADDKKLIAEKLDMLQKEQMIEDERKKEVESEVIELREVVRICTEVMGKSPKELSTAISQLKKDHEYMYWKYTKLQNEYNDEIIQKQQQIFLLTEQMAMLKQSITYMEGEKIVGQNELPAKVNNKSKEKDTDDDCIAKEHNKITANIFTDASRISPLGKPLKTSTPISQSDKRETSGSDYLDIEIDRNKNDVKLIHVKSKTPKSTPNFCTSKSLGSVKSAKKSTVKSCGPSQTAKNNSVSSSQTAKNNSLSSSAHNKAKNKMSFYDDQASKDEEEVVITSESKKRKVDISSKKFKMTPTIFQNLLSDANYKPNKFFKSRNPGNDLTKKENKFFTANTNSFDLFDFDE